MPTQPVGYICMVSKRRAVIAFASGKPAAITNYPGAEREEDLEDERSGKEKIQLAISHSKNPSWGTKGAKPLSILQAQLSCPAQHREAQSQAIPTESCSNCKIKSKYMVMFKPLSFGGNLLHCNK